MAKAEKKVLQPVLQPTIVHTVVAPIITPSSPGMVEIEANGGTFTTTQAMWDRVYSKRSNFTLKKK